MNIALNPEATTDQSCETYRKATHQSEAVTLSAARVADTSVTQSVEAYERSKNALDAGVDIMARSFDALGQGAAALNRKIIEIAQQNVKLRLRLGEGLGHGHDARRGFGVTGSLLAQAVQRTRCSS
jgi:hypothetical protein